MIDKKRIPKILNHLEEIWNENPDLRLGQIIMIATRPKSTCPEVFYIEDEEILKGIRSIGKKIESSNEKRKPYWEIYPEIIRTSLDEVNLELVKNFVDAVRKENPSEILTPRNMMKLVGAPIEDSDWLNNQIERVKKIAGILKELENNGELEKVEIGYKLKNKAST
jgi:hypothetical protein